MRLKIQTCILEIFSSVLVLGFRQFAVFELKIFFISIKWEINVVVYTFLMRHRIWTHILLTQWGGLFQVCQCWGLCLWADNLCYLSSRIFSSSKSKKINVCLLCQWNARVKPTFLWVEMEGFKNCCFIIEMTICIFTTQHWFHYHKEKNVLPPFLTWKRSQTCSTCPLKVLRMVLCVITQASLTSNWKLGPSNF